MRACAALLCLHQAGLTLWPPAAVCLLHPRRRRCSSATLPLRRPSRCPTLRWTLCTSMRGGWVGGWREWSGVAGWSTQTRTPATSMPQQYACLRRCSHPSWIAHRDACRLAPAPDAPGRHDYCGVSEDLAAWWPKLRSGGLLSGHDYVDTAELRARGAPQDTWSRECARPIAADSSLCCGGSGRACLLAGPCPCACVARHRMPRPPSPTNAALACSVRQWHASRRCGEGRRQRFCPAARPDHRRHIRVRTAAASFHWGCCCCCLLRRACRWEPRDA